MRLKITSDEIRAYLEIEGPEFPKYTAPLMNLANRYAKGTVPAVVGQMNDLIQEFTGKTLAEWEQWYLAKKPDAIRQATEKVVAMLRRLRNAIDQIDEDLVSRWVRDLVIVKTFAGLRFQEAVLKKGAELKGVPYRLANPEEESKGIDGLIGDAAVSIKPETYRGKPELREQIQARIIYYQKVDDGLEVDYGEVFA
jgi:uncharacterized protein YukE